MRITGKGLVTGALLLFVAVTLAVALRQEFRRGEGTLVPPLSASSPSRPADAVPGKALVRP